MTVYAVCCEPSLKVTEIVELFTTEELAIAYCEAHNREYRYPGLWIEEREVRDVLPEPPVT